MIYVVNMNTILNKYTTNYAIIFNIYKNGLKKIT